MHLILIYLQIFILLPTLALAQSQIPFYQDPIWQITFIGCLLIVFLLSTKKMKTLIFGVALALGMVYLLIRLIQAWQGL